MRQWIDLFENADVNALEARFGNDNYPFHYEDDEDRTPEEIAELDAEDPDRERGPSIITDCGPWFSCDSWAEYVVQQLPGRAVAYGFWCEDNPGTKLEDFCDGHTFAIVDNRYIVDGWIKNVDEILPRAVFDLNNPVDAKIVKKYYGPRENWKPVNKTLAESVEYFNTGRREVLVHVNPAASALKNIVAKTKHEIARGFAYGGSIYIWDASSAIHQQIWKQVTDDGPNVGVFMVSTDLDTLITDSTGEIGQPSDFLFFKDEISGLFLYTMKARSFLLHDRSFKSLFKHLTPIDYREGAALYEVFGLSDKERWDKALDRQIGGSSSSSKGIGDTLKTATSRLPQLPQLGIGAENKRRGKSTRQIADYRGVRIEFDETLGASEVRRLTGYVKEAYEKLSRHGLEKILKMGPIVFLPFSKRNSGYTGFAFGSGDKTILINSDQYGDELETIIHECGHRLHFVVPSSFFPRIFKFWTTKRTYDWFVSDYAQTNAMEFFAELFMAYVYDRLSGEPRAWMDRFVQKYIR